MNTSSDDMPGVLLITTVPLWRTVRALGPRMRVLTLDPGRAAADGPLRVAVARRAVALLDAAEIPRAHVHGFGIGGIAAQELAMRHPDRVSRLVLAATSAGGAGAIPPDEQTRRFLARAAQIPAEEAAWAAIPYLYGELTRTRRGGRIGEDIARGLRAPAAAGSSCAQLGAARAADTAADLHRIAAPTLVVHGTADRLTPVVNAHRLADAIPRAQLLLIEGAGHLYMTDEPRADREILRFLLEERVTVPVARRGRRPRDAARATRA